MGEGQYLYLQSEADRLINAIALELGGGEKTRVLLQRQWSCDTSGNSGNRAKTDARRDVVK